LWPSLSSLAICQRDVVQKIPNAHSHADLENDAQIAADKVIASISWDSDLISKISNMSLTDKIALRVPPYASPSVHSGSEPVDVSHPNGLTRHQRIEKALRIIQNLEAQFFALDVT